MKSYYMTIPVLLVSMLFACSEMPAEKPENWLLKVGGNYISNKDLEIGIQNLPLETRRRITQENQQQVITRVLNDTVQKEIIYQEALAENIEQNEDFSKILERLEQQYEFQKKQTYVDFLLRQKADTQIQVTNEEAVKLYNENIKLFEAAEEREISHILVASKEEADDIYNQLYKGSAKFPDLAKSKSIHTPSAKQGGKIGYIRKGTMLPEIENVSFSLQKSGFFAKPVQSELGWHVIKLNDIRQVPARSYDDVKELLANELIVQKTNQARLSYYNSIKDKYPLLENNANKQDKPAENAATNQDSK